MNALVRKDERRHGRVPVEGVLGDLGHRVSALHAGREVKVCRRRVRLVVADREFRPAGSHILENDTSLRKRLAGRVVSPACKDRKCRERECCERDKCILVIRYVHCTVTPMLLITPYDKRRDERLTRHICRAQPRFQPYNTNFRASMSTKLDTRHKHNALLFVPD